ncbi:SnoaL-like domain-containing protein [Amycolatopsis tolypomycina]|uniref:SnoaL-like domain-containing protein n=1 Tax=Amycolatopsis tolypomycina TaxID=208445 RepID=A0A1H4W9U2_9PSEU|nr:nuclear transport factor 2 family protein [Amycolatopsis tolypomycina]SEC89860.1 SnoaL-like domain-containing protein [Amycolatopsis tolypomycina]
MRRWGYAALGTALVAAVLGTPAAAATDAAGDGQRQCRQAFDHAVWEDMDSYNKRDAARYRAIIHRDMVTVGRRGQVIIGYDANVDPVLEQFKVPYEFSMPWTVTHTVVEDCKMGYAILDAHYLEPSHGIDRHFTISLTLVREHGRWQVVKDTVTDVVS